MKKLAGLIVVSLLLVSVSCAEPLAPASTPGLPGESPARYPFAPGRYFWPKPDWALDEPSLGEVPAGNPGSLRLPTDEEKDRMVEIVLNTPEASTWRGKESEYRAELIWYTPQDPTVKNSQMLSFGYYKALYEIYSELYWRPSSLPKSAIWYPGVRIGFETPQQLVVEAAVDLETGQPIYVSSYQDARRESNLRWLTDEEKRRAIELALHTREAKARLKKESTYRIGLSWQAIWDGGYRVFPYEAVVEGIPLYVPESESKTIYPSVTIWFGEPAEHVVSVAVDLKRGKVVSSDSYPMRW